ncbi:MAG: competence/damage-inducible protein A [Rickettsiales bacterium]|nr:competence/damage-inducible protein A [Rickettsiales bacterium]|tara:strand:- start:208 stop:975 length:768 start_codon:yes stop_codon:yes gene_type:complete
MKKIKTLSAAILIIGNEILSGKTQDKNIKFISDRCNKIGIRLREVRIIEDIKKIIINNIRTLSKNFDYVFTTGGIGPTHDDITAASVAEAFERNLILNKKAKSLLEEYYKKSGVNLNESRLKMAYIPKNAFLIKNSISAAPGFKIKNVWVMAGIPKIMQAMFIEGVEPHINKGTPICSQSIKVYIPEGEIAKILEKTQQKFLNIDIGSYPFYKPPKIGTTITCRGPDKKLVIEAIKLLCKSFAKANIQFLLGKKE